MSNDDIVKLMENLDAIQNEEVETVEETEQLEEAAFAKRHYTLIADVIKNDLGGDPAIAQAFANALRGDNPRFNEQFFIDYATGATSAKRPPRV